MKRPQLVLALLLAASCRQVLGIEEAELDPTLTAAGTASDPLESAGQPAEGGAAGAGGSSGGAAGGTGVPSEGGAAGAAAPSLCERYCELVAQHCTGPFAVYTSDAACLAVCQSLPAGTEGDGNVNSVHCRLRAAQAARDEVAHYCAGAGPGGNGVCGSNCEGLCTLRRAVCAPYGVVEGSACQKDCAALEDLGGYSTAVDAQHYSGAHVQCRLYHVSAAPLADTEKHCGHAAGDAPCN